MALEHQNKDREARHSASWFALLTSPDRGTSNNWPISVAVKSEIVCLAGAARIMFKRLQRTAAS